MSSRIKELAERGQSVWYDFITRDLVTGGELERLIEEDGLRGMTSNPTIFEKAVSGSDLYDADLRRLSEEGRDAAGIFDELSLEDVRDACDHFRPVFDELKNGDGTVSIEVAPALADDTAATLAEAQRLWEGVGRPNALVKIPGTAAGIPAIEQATTAGVSVNITLLFSVDRYREVIEAYFKGLETRLAKGDPVNGIHSVASFFVSRVDSKIDPMLDQKGDPEKVRGRAAIANAAKAYQLFEEVMASERWRSLAAQGANLQRPLWASTSTKDDRYPDVYYVSSLIAPYTVNTLPPETFEAWKDHGSFDHDIRDAIARADDDLAKLAKSGIDLKQATDELEREGVEKFTKSYDKLVEGIDAKLGELAGKS